MTLMGPMDSKRGESSVQTIEHETMPETLWGEYWEDRSIELRNRLVTYYAPLVTIVARRFAQRSRSMESLEELYSFGCFGLIDAVERWDASEGFKFATYATRRIQGAILDELRREDFLPKRLRARVQIYNVTRDDVTARLHRSPTIREMADELGVSVDEAIKLHDEATVLTHLAPLVTGSEASEGRVLGAASPAPSPVERAEMAETIDMVKAALRRLTERQRQVLVLHFLEGMTKGEIADVLGVGRSRITQLMQQGLRNLQIELGLEVPDDVTTGAPRPRAPGALVGRFRPRRRTRSQSAVSGAGGEDVGKAGRQPPDLRQRGAACSRVEQAERVLDAGDDRTLAECAEGGGSRPDPDGGFRFAGNDGHQRAGRGQAAGPQTRRPLQRPRHGQLRPDPGRGGEGLEPVRKARPCAFDKDIGQRRRLAKHASQHGDEVRLGQGLRDLRRRAAGAEQPPYELADVCLEDAV